MAANLVLSMNSVEGRALGARATSSARQAMRKGIDPRERAWLDATAGLGRRRHRQEPRRSTRRWSPNGRATCWPASSASCMPSTCGDSEALLRIGEHLFAANPRQSLRLRHVCLRPGGVQSRSTRPRRTRASAIEMRAQGSVGASRLAHCLEARGRMLEGVAFLQSVADTWEDCNSFMYTHNWWHLALFLIDLDRTDEALALFDTRVWGVWKEFSEDQINAVSLLARLELRGVDVGDALGRCRVAISKAAPARALRALPRPAISLCAGARRQAERRHRDAGEPRGPRRAGQAVRARSVGRLRRAGRARACRACRGEHAEAARLLGQAMPHLQPIGGSIAQRALFGAIHLDALIRSGWNDAALGDPAGRRARAADRALDQARAGRPLSQARPHRAGDGRRLPGRAAWRADMPSTARTGDRHDRRSHAADARARSRTLYAKGKASPVETMKAVLARAEKVNPTINALCVDRCRARRSRRPRLGAALEEGQAAVADRRRAGLDQGAGAREGLAGLDGQQAHRQDAGRCRCAGGGAAARGGRHRVRAEHQLGVSATRA